ncbi:MAG: hypothetical protein CMO55_13290 [Verrucomicrobiales bacterium]|nr:hypothetical protein [Verrucomicrobiales bacterium]
MNQTELIPTCRFAVKSEDSGILCHCAQVKEATVHRAVQEGVVDSVESVMAETGAGTGCRACHCRINRVLSGLPAQCGGRFDRCHGCGCISALCACEAA